MTMGRPRPSGGSVDELQLAPADDRAGRPGGGRPASGEWGEGGVVVALGDAGCALSRASVRTHSPRARRPRLLPGAGARERRPGSGPPRGADRSFAAL